VADARDFGEAIGDHVRARSTGQLHGRKEHDMKKRYVVLVAAALLAVAAGAGYAAIPGSSGTISACKDNKGVLRVIDAEAGQSCGNNQQLLTWNQQGPAGAQGEPGGPLAYAKVSEDGTMDPSKSKNMEGVTIAHPSFGIYCFEGLGFVPKSISVTLGGYSGAGTGSYVVVPHGAVGDASGCASGTDAGVMMVDPATTAASRDHNFYVVFN
jgi:hypothetical protein